MQLAPNFSLCRLQVWVCPWRCNHGAFNFTLAPWVEEITLVATHSVICALLHWLKYKYPLRFCVIFLQCSFAAAELLIIFPSPDTFDIPLHLALTLFSCFILLLNIDCTQLWYNVPPCFYFECSRWQLVCHISGYVNQVYLLVLWLSTFSCLFFCSFLVFQRIFAFLLLWCHEFYKHWNIMLYLHK